MHVNAPLLPHAHMAALRQPGINSPCPGPNMGRRTHLLSSPTAHLARTASALRDPNFRLLWLCSVLSQASRSMEATLLTWLVLEMTGSALNVALVGVFGWTPLLMFGLVGGALADTTNRKRLFATTLAINLATVVILAVVLAMDRVQVWHAYTAILITGSCYALGMASRRSLIHDIVGRDRVTNAVALDTLGGNTSAMLGPALAGFLIGRVGVAAGYVVLAVSLSTSLLLLWKLESPPHARRSLDDVQIGRTLITGLKYVAGRHTLLATVAIAFVINLTVTPYVNMTPVMARDVLMVSPELMGILLSGHGMGALVGSLLVASAVAIRYHGRVYIAGSMLLLAAVLVFSISRSYALSLAVVAIAGLGNAGFNTMQMSLTMLLPRDEMRGAALGAMSLGIGGGPVGMLITGVVANSAGAPTALSINAVVGIAALSLIAILVPSMRRQTVPDGGMRLNESPGVKSA